MHASAVAKPPWLLIVNLMNSMKESALKHKYIITVRRGEEIRCLLSTKTGDIPYTNSAQPLRTNKSSEFVSHFHCKERREIGTLKACDDEATSHAREAAALRV